MEYRVSYSEIYTFTVVVTADNADEARTIVAEGGVTPGEPDSIELDGDINNWYVEEVKP